jgi:hypothetical protein
MLVNEYFCCTHVVAQAVHEGQRLYRRLLYVVRHPSIQHPSLALVVPWQLCRSVRQSSKAHATLLELLEAQGLPLLCVTSTTPLQASLIVQARNVTPATLPRTPPPPRTTGLSIKAQATLLELLEAQGLPLLCVTMAVKEDAARKLGEVLATAVKVGSSVSFLYDHGGWGLPIPV